MSNTGAYSHNTNSPSYPMSRATRCPLDPPPELGQLRVERPVTRVTLWDGSTPWLVTRHADVRAVLADPRISADIQNPSYPIVAPARIQQRQPSPYFVFMDDPEHARLRKMLAKDFTVRGSEAFRPMVNQTVNELLDAMERGPNPTDLLQAFALPLPSMVMCQLLGVPYSDHTTFQRWTAAMESLGEDAEGAVRAVEELNAYLTDIIEQRLADDYESEDVYTTLIRTYVKTGQCSVAEAVAMGNLLLVAGHDTTANQIALGVVMLLQHPEQAELLRTSSSPEVAANAVEELLRYLTVVHSARPRVATADLEIDGVQIRAGDGLLLSTEAANRDADAFPDPDVLDITRSARGHLAFGFGVHQCLGAPLARMELQIAYTELFRRFPTLRLTTSVEELKYKNSAVYGVRELPVAW